MKKILLFRVSEEEYNRIQKLAKIAGENVSQFVRKKIKESIEEEIKDTSLLERLIRNIEDLKNFKLPGAHDTEIEKDIYKLLLYLVWHEKVVAENIILMEQKRKEYMKKREEIQKKLGLDLE